MPTVLLNPYFYKSASRCTATCSHRVGGILLTMSEKWGLYECQWKSLFGKMLNACWAICWGSSRSGEVEGVSWENPHHGNSPSWGENFPKNFNISLFTTSFFVLWGYVTTSRMSAFCDTFYWVSHSYKVCFFSHFLSCKVLVVPSGVAKKMNIWLIY